MARLARNKKSQKRTRERQRQQGIDELTIEDGVDSGTRERESALAWGSDLGFHQNGWKEIIHSLQTKPENNKSIKDKKEEQTNRP